MKKAVISFVAFCVVFVAALGLITTQANPAVTLPDTQDITWHGHVDTEYGTYNGALLNDLFNGHGDFAFVTGESYSGNWENSYMTGNGTVVFPEVGEYSGELRESKRNGQGTFSWYSGEEYIGNWNNDHMDGSGQYTFANGSIFTGAFRNNKPIEGTLTYKAKLSDDAAETEIVELTYVITKEMKKITFVTKGGLKYDGDVEGLLESGMATITYPSGNDYTGEVLKGQRNGIGQYTWKDEKGKTRSYYEGSWVKDRMHGQGKYHYTAALYPYLYGKYENNLPTGTLTYYKAAGNTFETTWSNGTCTSVKET